MAAMRGSAELVALLCDNGATEVRDSAGWTPLLVACAAEVRWPAALELLQRGFSASTTTYGSSLSTLMLAARWRQGGAEAMKVLLRNGVDPMLVDNFGQTALHLACREGSVDVIAALCESGASPCAQDNDGTYPLQLLCRRCAVAPDDRELVDGAMASLLRREPAAASLLDFGDASPLHTLCLYASLEHTAPLAALRLLLEARADVTAEEEGGWTAAHFAAAAGGEAKEAMLSVLRAATPSQLDFWDKLDLAKPRDTSNRKYLSRRGGHHRISEQERHDVLRGELTLAGIARRITEGRSRNVVVLLGAGASTSAGIPDFRSPSGLWSQPAARQLFSPEGFAADPEAFWRHSSELFLGRRPTPFHELLVRLHQHGVLRRVYTQNIDGLEVAAGLPQELVVECHGSVLRARCSADPSHAVGPPDFAAAMAAEGAAWRAPRCRACGAPVRPDVVFFGEPLPADFALLSGQDFNECDLLVVAGTALSVYPVAGLVQRVGPLVPRLLINKKVVGVWSASLDSDSNYRDVFRAGDCDAGARDLAVLLGWSL